MRRARLRTTVNLAAAQNRRRQGDKPDAAGVEPTPKNDKSDANAESESSKKDETLQIKETCEVLETSNAEATQPISESESSSGRNNEVDHDPQSNSNVILNETSNGNNDSEFNPVNNTSSEGPKNDATVSEVKRGDDSSSEAQTCSKEGKLEKQATSDPNLSENSVSLMQSIFYQDL